MSTQQGLRQASFRSIADSSLTYNGDARAAFEAEATIPAGSTYNESLLRWLQDRLSSASTSLPGLLAEFAAAESADKWSSVGNFLPQAAVTLDTFTAGTVGTSATPWAGVNHEQGAAADYALVLVSFEQDVTIGVTYGGVAMTAGPVGGPGAASQSHVQSFWLAAEDLPAAGTIEVVVTPSLVASGVVGIWTLIGAEQGAPSRDHSHEGGSGATSTVTLSAVPAGAFIASGHNNNDGSPAPSVSGGDVKAAVTIGAGGGSHGCGMAESFPTLDGDVTHIWTHQGTTRFASLMVEILAA